MFNPKTFENSRVDGVSVLEIIESRSIATNTEPFHPSNRRKNQGGGHAVMG